MFFWSQPRRPMYKYTICLLYYESQRNLFCFLKRTQKDNTIAQRNHQKVQLNDPLLKQLKRSLSFIIL